MKLISWNVNGLRACMTKGFADFMTASDADMRAGDQDAAGTGDL